MGTSCARPAVPGKQTSDPVDKAGPLPHEGFPGDSVVKNLRANAGDTRDVV